MPQVSVRYVGLVALLALGQGACHDLSSFSTNGGSYLGPVVPADFVRSGIGTNVNLCLTFDVDHLQDTPGTLSTSDGLFDATPLRSIPQLWQDPLSTLQFGEGRTKNLIYVATSRTDGGSGADVMVVISLMESGSVEVRLLQGAPNFAPDGGAASGAQNLFAVFSLTRQSSPCAF